MRTDSHWELAANGLNGLGDQTDYTLTTRKWDTSNATPQLDVTTIQSSQGLRYNGLGQLIYSFVSNHEIGNGIDATTTEERSGIGSANGVYTPILYDEQNQQLDYHLVSVDAYGNVTTTDRTGVTYDLLGHLVSYHEETQEPVYWRHARHLAATRTRLVGLWIQWRRTTHRFSTTRNRI